MLLVLTKILKIEVLREFYFTTSFLKDTEEPEFQHFKIGIFANPGMAPGMPRRIFIQEDIYSFFPQTHSYFIFFFNPVTFQNYSSFGKITEWKTDNVSFCTFAAV